MALATVDIVRLTGTAGAETETSITAGSTTWSTSDSPTPGTSDPVPVPGAGTNYSYWVTTRLKATTNASGNTLNNLRWYTSTNTPPTGVTYKGAKASTGTNSGYRQATGTPGSTGTELTTGNHSGLDATPASVFTYTSGSPLSLTGSTTSTGRFGDHFVFQVAVTSAAAAQTAPSETFNWRYDEA